MIKSKLFRYGVMNDFKLTCKDFHVVSVGHYAQFLGMQRRSSQASPDTF